MDDIYVHIVPLPVKECVTQNPDGSYSVFISDSISDEEQRKMYAHALRHIMNNDFEDRSEKNAQYLEKEAHKEE